MACIYSFAPSTDDCPEKSIIHSKTKPTQYIYMCGPSTHIEQQN